MKNPRKIAPGQDVSPLVFIISQRLLTILNRSDPRFLWRALKKGNYKLSEQLSREILAAPYIDYLRSKIDKDRELFDRIENTAACAREFQAAFKYPYTIILLLSVMRKFLAKDTNLYELGKKSYEHFKKRSGTNLAAREIAVELGIQIYRREGDLESEENIWPYLQLEFQHPEALYARRMQFYQTDDPRKLFRLTTQRWIRNPEQEKVYNQLRRESLQFLGALHPQLIELPVPYGSADALRAVDSISNSLKAGTQRSFLREQNRDHLAKNLRVVQWDLFTRDLIVEQAERKLSYKSSLTGENKGLPPDDFLDLVAEQNCLAHCHYFPLHSGILRDREGPKDHCKVSDVKELLKAYRLGFGKLLSKAEKYNPRSYDDVIESFSYEENRASTARSFAKALLVEDGELTFFVVLWLLRHAVHLGENPEVWQDNPSRHLSVDFCPTLEAETYNAWWHTKDLASFAQLCGLTVPSHRHGYLILTRRWRSLVRWLGRQARILRDAKETSASDDGSLLEALPVKRIRDLRKQDSPEHKFAVALQDFFTSEELCKYVTGLRVFPDEIPIKEFATKHIGVLITIAYQLLIVSPDATPGSDEQDEPWPYRDRVLIRMSRAGFLPLEHLFRVYQPYELHLLVLALSFTKTELVDQRPAPVSLAFATIAGALLPGVARGMTEHHGSGIPAQQMTGNDSPQSRARRWLAPYWTLFTALSSELSVTNVQKASKQAGFAEMLSAFGHEVAKVESYVFNNLFMHLGDVFAVDDQDEVTDFIRGLSKWSVPAGKILPRNSDVNISDWRVCPTPNLLTKLNRLYVVWMGPKVTVEDLGINSIGAFDNFLEELIPLAREMAVARRMVDNLNPIRSLHSALRIDDSTEVIEHAAKISLVPPKDPLQLNADIDNSDAMMKIFLARTLLAALSNAVQHTTKLGGKVTVEVHVVQGTVVIEISNPAETASGDPQKAIDAVALLSSKTQFGFGSEAVIQACISQLGGTAEITKSESEKELRYLTRIEFPLPKVKEKDIDPWITVKARS